jgi:hypothetical protein
VLLSAGCIGTHTQEAVVQNEEAVVPRLNVPLQAWPVMAWERVRLPPPSRYAAPTPAPTKEAAGGTGPRMLCCTTHPRCA